MSTILPNPKLVKIEDDQFQSVSIDREKFVKMELEMVNLVRERDWLRKEVDLFEKTQSYTELVKCSLEEKLRMSERRCEKLEGKIKKFEDLRRKEVNIAKAFDELRVKKMEAEKAARLYKSRVDDLELRMLKVEAALANLEKFAAGFTDAGGENESIGLSKKGGRNLAYSCREEDVTNVLSGSKRASKAAESKCPLEFSGAGYGMKMKLSCKCRLKIIDVIKDNLHKENLEILEGSCFGNLLKISELKFQGNLILQLLLHMDMSASDEDRLIFKINNTYLEFGPSDFFRITSLHCGKLEARITTSSSSFQKDVFQGRPCISLKDIEEAFLNVSSCHKGKGELALKLALLYFLDGILLTNRSKGIDVQYLYLIEDLQKFNAFPWGRVAYDVLVSSILQLRLRIGGSKVTHQVTRFDIHGFCYALQIWAYEVMPSVAACCCAFRANNFENITPWILRWSVAKILQSPTDKAHLNSTMEKWEVLSTDTVLHAATPLNKAKPKKRKFLCDNDQMHHTTTRTTPPPSFMNASTHLSHHLAHRLSRAEGMLESLLRKVDHPIFDIGNFRTSQNWIS